MTERMGKTEAVRKLPLVIIYFVIVGLDPTIQEISDSLIKAIVPSLSREVGHCVITGKCYM